MKRIAVILFFVYVLSGTLTNSPQYVDTDGNPVSGDRQAEIAVYSSAAGGDPIWRGLAGPELPMIHFVKGIPVNLEEMIPALVAARSELWVEIDAEGVRRTAERIQILPSGGHATSLRRDVSGSGEITETLDDDLILGVAGDELYVDSDRTGFGDYAPNERVTVSGALSMQKATVPPTSTAGYGKVYVDDGSGHLMYLDDSGTPTDLLETTEGGIPSVSSSANTTGRTEHMRFIPGISTAITESGTDDTIYIRYDINSSSTGCTTAPSQPDPIDGITPVCSGEPGTSYGVAPVDYANYYRWTLPTGSSVVSGFGSNIIHAYLGDFDGNICVKAVNSCGESPVRCFSVTINRPTSPGPITGASLVCSDTTGLTYYIDAVPEATNYIWTLPPGATIASGSGTPSIVVNFGSEDGEVCVRTENSCGRSEPECLAVTITNTPATPGAITGSTSHCQYSSQTYSISSVSEATNYVWTVPSGASITGGSGTATIDVSFGTASGNVCVQAQSICGISPSRCLGVTVINPPAAPGTISGSDVVVPGSTGEGYAISAVSGADPTGYNWYVASGDASIPGATNSTSVSVNFGMTPGPVSLCVTASNSCGTSSPTCKSILNSVPAGSVTYNYSGSIVTWTVPAFVYSIQVECRGAEGGNPGTNCTYGETPGRGARMIATFPVTPGDQYRVLVGQKGYNGVDYGSGGGGGSFFVKLTGGNTPYLIAGGGGGCGYYASTHDGGPGLTGTSGGTGVPSGGTAGTGGNGGGTGYNTSWSGAGGGGYSGNGANSTSSGTTPRAGGGYSFLNGGAGGIGAASPYGAAGGFGGGGGGMVSGGGGGGYSGGGGGGIVAANYYTAGGGGGSYTYSSGTLTTATAGYQTGNGQVIISWGS